MKKLITCLMLSVLAPLGFAFEPNPEIDRTYAALIAELPVKGQLISIPYVETLYSYGKIATTKIIDSKPAPGDKALLVNVKKRGENIWDAGVNTNIVGEIKSGDAVFLAFFARVVEPSAQTGKSFLRVGVQQAVSPYKAVMIDDIQLTSNWAVYFVSGESTYSYKAEGSQVSIQVAEDKQIIEIGPVFVFNLGQNIDIDKLPKNN